MLKIRSFAAIAGLMLLSASAFASVKLPVPYGYVNDYAGVIDSASSARMERAIEALKKKTGAEISVVTVKTTDPLTPKEYATEILNKWGIGQKGKDNGLVLLTAIEERRTEIETGYGLEGSITDGFAGRVMDEKLIPQMRKGDFGTGMADSVDMLAAQIEKDINEGGGTKKSSDNSLLFIIFGVIFALIVLAMVKTRSLGASLFSALIGAVIGFVFAQIIGAVIGAVIGLMMAGSGGKGLSGGPGWGGSSGRWTGGFGGGSFGGGFGGFSGGSSGGGGAGRSW